MRISHFISVCVVGCALSLPLFPQSVRAIQVSGLKKTRASYMQQVLERFLDVPEEELDLQEVETVLQEQGLFSDIQLGVDRDEENELILTVQVTEKISFLPLPFVSYSSNGFMGGLMVMDTNAFGVKDNYVIGGIFSRAMQMGLTSFSKPSLSRAQPGFSLFASGAHRNNELTNSDKDTVLAYTGIGANASVSLSDKVTEHATVTFGVGYNYHNIDVDDGYEAYEDDMRTYHAFSINGGWRMSVPLLNEWFLSNKTASLNGSMTLFSTGKKSPSVHASVSVQQPLPLARLRLLGQLAGFYTKNNHIALYSSSSSVGITILPAKFHAPRMAGATLGVEAGIVKTRIATFSVYGLYEYVLAEEWGGDLLMNHGYSAGIKMYLAKIAFPALSAGIAHNVSKNLLQFSAAFGVAF